MKRFLAVAVALLVLAACDNGNGGSDPNHTHDFSDRSWQHNAAQHWYECDCGAKSGLTAHSFAGGICGVCGFNSRITYTVEQVGGASGTATTTDLRFTFSRDVTDLFDNTGVVTMEHPTAKGYRYTTFHLNDIDNPSGNIWLVPLSDRSFYGGGYNNESIAGKAFISINKAGIETETKTVIIHKAGMSTPPPHANIALSRLRPGLGDEARFSSSWRPGPGSYTIPNSNYNNGSTIDVVDLIRRGNKTGAVANGGIDNDSVQYGIVPDTLSQLSYQSAQLQAFFNDCRGGPFANMAAIENQIRTKVQSTTPQAFVAAVDTARTAMVNVLTQGMNSADKTKFDMMLTGYQAGHYLITRDWQTTEAKTQEQLDSYHGERVDDFREAVKVATGNYPTAGNYSNGRGNTVKNIGSNPKGWLTQIETALVNAGVAALGLMGTLEELQARDMVKALIIQFGQDTVEFQAFVDDIVAEPTIHTADTMTYTVTPTAVTVPRF